MLFMLDTNPCICAIKHRPPEVLDALLRHENDGLGVSSITAAESFFGVATSGSLRNRSALHQFLEPLEIADVDRAAAAAYGSLRATLEAVGTPIRPLDTQIAAHALASASPWSAATRESSHGCPGCAWSSGSTRPDAP